MQTGTVGSWQAKEAARTTHCALRLRSGEPTTRAEAERGRSLTRSLTSLACRSEARPRPSTIQQQHRKLMLYFRVRILQYKVFLGLTRA